MAPYNRPLQPPAIMTRDQPTAGGAAAERPIRYLVVRLCLASLSAHGESAPGQFLVGLR